MVPAVECLGPNIRLDCVQMIGRLRVHGDVTSLEVCHDGRTLVLGCSDGGLQSYVIVDVDCDDDWGSILAHMTSRGPNNSTNNKRPATTTSATTTRQWDKVIYLSTLCLKNVRHFYFSNNFVKHWQILIILACNIRKKLRKWL